MRIFFFLTIGITNTTPLYRITALIFQDRSDMSNDMDESFNAMSIRFSKLNFLL